MSILLVSLYKGYGQSALIVNLALLDGVELRPSNVLNYDILNNTGKSQDVMVKGTLLYRHSTLRASYTYRTSLSPGTNRMSIDKARELNWVFSDNALKELFFEYGKLPQGTYEYCVSVTPVTNQLENPLDDVIDECIYQTVSDLFLINLVSPENDAKIAEYNPMLNWAVNYPFASQLTYRLRVAELKKGQNNENAINRNNPIFEDKQVTATGLIYPPTAKPLIVYQPYVWTVDAYYKGILLGGAEVWRFIIVEDSLLKEYNAVQSYYDFAGHYGETRITGIGELRLKYVSDKMNDSLSVKIMDENNKETKIPQPLIGMHNGDNFFVIPLYEKVRLSHGKHYFLQLANKDQKTFIIPFKYLNPLFVE